jgi:hypothetical protein
MMSTALKTAADLLVKLLSFAVTAAMALTILVVSMHSATAVLGSQRDGYQALGFLFWIAFATLAVLVHEIGHAVAARSVGWDVHLITVFRFSLRTKARRIFVWPGGSRDRGAGSVFATPARLESWDKSWAVVILGGPLANLLIASVAYAALVRLHPEPFRTGLLGGIAATQGAVGLANLLPFRWRTHTSDGAKLLGAKLLGLMLGKTSTADQRALHRLHGLSIDGADPSGWSRDLIERIAQARFTSPEDAIRFSVLFNHGLSRGDIRGAYDLIEQARNNASFGLLPYQSAYAFLIAMVERDADRAEAMLSLVPEKARADFGYWRARACVDALRGQHPQARESVAKALQWAKKSGARPDADDRKLFDAIERGEPLPFAFERAEAA